MTANRLLGFGGGRELAKLIISMRTDSAQWNLWEPCGQKFH